MIDTLRIKKIPGTTNCYISSYGDVICGSPGSEEFILPTHFFRNYLYVTLPNEQVLIVNRLVCELFVPCEGGYDNVHHIDGNTHNNYAGNLTWVSVDELMAIQSEMKLFPVNYIECSQTLELFRTVQEAADYFSVDPDAIDVDQSRSVALQVARADGPVEFWGNGLTFRRVIRQEAHDLGAQFCKDRAKRTLKQYGERADALITCFRNMEMWK